MRIAVCMKQVPAYSEGNMDEKTGLIVRAGVESVVNPYDLAALETALRIKEDIQAEVDVYTMGPESAEQILREAYALGADRCCLISDKAFGGADVLATSHTIMQAMSSQCDDYDLVLCGKQTTDGDTGFVGGALARWLERQHFVGVTEISNVTEDGMRIVQKLEHSALTWDICFPCLVAVERDIFPVRMPTLKSRMAAKKKEVFRIGLKDLQDTDENHYGIRGSATKVKRVFPPERLKRKEPITATGKESADYIFDILSGVIKQESEAK